MKRIVICETPLLVGKEVRLEGWVNICRDHGKVVFIDLRDRSGYLQLVITGQNKKTFDTAKEIRPEFVVRVEGKVKERPKNLWNEKIETGKIEVEVSDLDIISPTEGELPLDISQPELNLNLQTLLKFRNLSLRNEKIKSIFYLYAQILDSYKESLKKRGFLEIKTPKVVSAATEGGANFFKIKYFDRDAYLAQSPQFYKQMGMGIFERVFEVGPVFRAEPHFTSRHLNEYISLDAEMGFIDSYEDLMDELEKTVWDIMGSIFEKCQKVLDLYGVRVPERVEIPRITLSEAVEILKKEFGKELEDLDIDPEGERLICEFVKKTYGSDFVFLTQYPTAIRPMYTMPSEKDKNLTNSFDLLFRGVEIATGGQRIHNYHQLVESIEKRKMKPEDFKDYLEIFKYGMPSHGGWGMGSERIAQKILGLKSVKEATLYPRDVRRITP